MIHISKTKKRQFIVAVVSDKNGKVISCSEPLKTRGNAKKNICALLTATDNPYAKVQDNTGKNPVVFRLWDNGKRGDSDNIKIRKPYLPK